MRIVRLDLLAFGPFTGQSLDFDQPDYSLQIVYGPNEAGKSTCLRALQQWLYGIPHSSSDSFLHANTNLRIGGRLENHSGQRLEFIRRKGREKTLRAADDLQVVDQVELDLMLGGVDEKSFRQRFGIDYEELRRGGREIVEGGGELGTILFAAGAGIANVRQLQAGIEQELRGIFLPSGSVPRINAGLKMLKEARDQVKQFQLPTAQWQECDEALRSAQQQQIEIDQQLLDLRSRQHRLERISTVLPILARRTQLHGKLAEVAEARKLPADFAARRSEACASLTAAEHSDQDSACEIDRLEQLIAQVEIPIGLLQRDGEITSLHTDLGSYRKGSKDRPGLQIQISIARENAEQILRELGREPDLSQADTLRLTRAQGQRIQELASECKARLESQLAAESDVRKLSSEIERLEKKMATLPIPRDFEPLMRAIRRAQRHGELDQEFAEALRVLRQTEAQASLELKKLQLFHGSMDELEQLQVPLLETLERFDQQLNAAHSEVEKITERIAGLSFQIEQVRLKLETLRLEHDLPSEEDLRVAREKRDVGWQLVQRLWRDGLADDQQVAMYTQPWSCDGDLAAAFQASLTAADSIVDRLRRESDRVAETAQLTTDLDQWTRQLTGEQVKLESAQQRSAQAQIDWREQWQPLGITTLTPREMLAWLRRHNALAGTAREIRLQRQRADEIQQLIDDLRSQLAAQLQNNGQPLSSQSQTLTDLLEQCEAVVLAIEAENRSRREVQQRIDQLQTDLAAEQQNCQAAEHGVDQWRAEWTTAVSALGLTGSEAPSQANQVLDAFKDLLQANKEIATLQRRVDGIDRDNRAFDEAVARLLIDVSLDIDLPVERAVSELYQRLQRAAQEQTKLKEWQQQLQSEQAKQAKSQAAITQWQKIIDAMCHQAGCQTPEELLVAEERSLLRREIEHELGLVNDQLVEQSSGEDLEAFLLEAQAYHADQLSAEIQQLSDTIFQLEAHKRDVLQDIGGYRGRLALMDGGDVAAKAQEEAEHCLAAIRSDADQYIRLRLASSVLQNAIDRFRKSSQDPILNRAGVLFAELTRGSFSSLRADYDDQGRAILVGVRPDGLQTVGVGGMSEGTCDQMYLALRLALLETHLREHQPLPLIVDDILIQFDDDRSLAALNVLNRMAQKTQVIFFTHHQRLIDLARKHLKNPLPQVYTLNNSENFRLVANSTDRESLGF